MEDMIIKEMKTSTASEDFKKNRLSGTRYVDKTAILVPLLRGDHESNFFLRPRRFGKTLTLSMFDTLEAFYHGAMLTLLGLNEDYICRSNRESGDGRFDVLCRQRRRWKLAFVLEFKISEKAKDLRKDAQKAAEQIDEMRYSADFWTRVTRRSWRTAFPSTKNAAVWRRGTSLSNSEPMQIIGDRNFFPLFADEICFL